MSRHLLQVTVVFFISAFAFWPAMAQNSEGKVDARVRDTLDKIGWKYEIGANGSFRLALEFAEREKRRQIVYIDSTTARFGSMEVRAVYSVAIRSENPLPADLANALLQDNGFLKVGGWALTRDGNQYTVCLVANIPADADRETLAATIRSVALAADEKEKQVMKTDTF